jgi:3-deoxy-D-manno-octulosonic acid kinase
MMPDAEATAVLERIARSRHGAVIFDAARLPECPQSWFTPRHWDERDAVRARARGRGTAWLVDTPAGRMFLRHYHRGGLVARANADRYLWTGFARARPVREFRALADANGAGLPVPAPVAGRVVRSGLWYRADILIAAIDVDMTLAERIAQKDVAVDWDGAGRAIGAVHRAGWFHADLNAHNVLFGWDGKAWVVDFDRARRMRPGARWQQANLSRLRRSLLKLVRGDAAAIEEGWSTLRAAHARTIGEPVADAAGLASGIAP